MRTAPELLPCGVFIVPLLSWPHEDFDREPPLALPPGETLRRPVEPACRCISDYGACVWPGFENGSRALAARFDAMQDLAPLLELRRRASWFKKEIVPLHVRWHSRVTTDLSHGDAVYYIFF